MTKNSLPTSAGYVRKTLVIILIFLIISIVLIFIFPLQSADMYYSLKYDTELGYLREYLFLLSEGKEIDIIRISTTDANILRPAVSSVLSDSLKRININSLRVRGAARITEDDDMTFLSTVYFENHPHMGLNMRLRYCSDRWLLDSVSFSDSPF